MKPRSRLATAALAAAACWLAAGRAPAASRSQPHYDPRRSTQSHRTAGGSDFPTWEREVDADERSPLPSGQPGRYVPAWTAELDAPPVGVAALGGRAVVAVTAAGKAHVYSLDGTSQRVVDLAARASQPPVEAGALALAPAGERVIALGVTGEAWRSEAGGRIDRPVAVHGGAAYVAREGGTLERLDLASGRRTWSAGIGAGLTAGPVASSRVVVVASGGDLAGFDAATGAPAWRVALGDRVDAVIVTDEVLVAAGLGVSQRSPGDVAPVIFGWRMSRGDARPQGKPWRLRVGGTCHAMPLSLDALVAFACSDGYVRAVEPRRGVGGWRTDLPAGSTVSPLLTGGRLDCVVPQSRHAVALGAENGAVLGWVTLPDEDETFVGTAAIAGGLTVTGTSMSRLVAWTWSWLEEPDAAASPGGITGEPLPAGAVPASGVPVAR